MADIGTLQRLPGLIGQQQARELAYTGREFTGCEAESMGLVLKCFDTHADMMAHVQSVTAAIAAKSPLAIRYTAETIITHSVPKTY